MTVSTIMIELFTVLSAVSFSTSLSIINKLSALKQNVSGMTGHKPAEVYRWSLYLCPLVCPSVTLVHSARAVGQNDMPFSSGMLLLLLS